MVVLFKTNRTDPTRNAVKFGSLTILEASTYLMAACFPLYRPLFQAARKRIGTKFSVTSTSGSRGTKKDLDSEELQSIRQAGFSDNGFERLEDGGGKIVVTSQKHNFGTHRNDEASSIESSLDRSRSRIQVKKEFVVATSESV